jgi:hypothetical protein
VGGGSGIGIATGGVSALCTRRVDVGTDKREVVAVVVAGSGSGVVSHVDRGLSLHIAVEHNSSRYHGRGDYNHSLLDDTPLPPRSASVIHSVLAPVSQTARLQLRNAMQSGRTEPVRFHFPDNSFRQIVPWFVTHCAGGEQTSRAYKRSVTYGLKSV